MNFSEAKEHAMGVLFDTEYFSKFVTYTPNGGVAIPDVPVNIQYGVSQSDNRQGDGQTWRLTVERDFRSNFNSGGTRNIATIVVRVSNIASPEYGDTIEFGGDTWVVKDVFDHV